MTGPQPFIPALPLLVPLALAAFIVLAHELQRRGAATGPRLATAAVACVYGAGVLDAVLLPLPILVGSAREGMPPWSVFVNLTPLEVGLQDPIGLVLNVALFVPLGLLLPLVLRTPSAGRVVMTGLLVSLAIEVVQLLADVTVSTGRVADIDDLLCNTLGVAIGYALFRILLCLPGACDMADPIVTWRPSGLLGPGCR